MGFDWDGQRQAQQRKGKTDEGKKTPKKKKEKLKGKKKPKELRLKKAYAMAWETKSLQDSRRHSAGQRGQRLGFL